MSRDFQKITIVCPAYQEEEVLPLFHRELIAVLAEVEKDFDFEILYVDDGSRDRTLSVIRDLGAGDNRVRFLSFSGSCGHQAALTADLEQARCCDVIVMYSDMQQPPA